MPVLAFDPVSSNAHATQEKLVVLAPSGNVALALVVPISVAVAMLLGIVVISYRHTVRALKRPGAFRVAYESWAWFPGFSPHRLIAIAVRLIVERRRNRILHDQTALIVKRHLLFETGVVVASAPYRVESSVPSASGR